MNEANLMVASNRDAGKPTGTRIFSSLIDFINWMKEHADEPLIKALEPMGAAIHELEDIVEAAADVRGDGTMLKLSANLGTAIPRFMILAEEMACLPDGPARKAFVLAAAIATFRLIQLEQVNEDHRTEHALIFPEGTMEPAFVVPLAEQSIDKTLRMVRDVVKKRQEKRDKEREKQAE